MKHLFLHIIVFICCTTGICQNQILNYGDTTSLTGKVLQVTYEMPTGDKYKTYILQLAKPVNINSSSEWEKLSEVTQVHLNIPNIEIEKLKHRQVRVSGLLFHALTIHHRRDLCIKVEKVSAISEDSLIAGKPNLPTIGEKIEGDFNGDGKKDFATVSKTKEGKGNPVEGGTPDEYEIQFSGNNLKSIKPGCCEIRLINEGDLNNDGADEISIFQAPANGCTYSMATYSYMNRTWKQVVKTFLIPTGCDNISDDDLQKRIFYEENSIYYYDFDLNDESGKLVKKKATAQ